MYDPKFEKEVQRKMEELEFSPSEAVWTNIAQAVNADRRRRRVPFFWWFLSGALLLGAGTVYLGSRSSTPATARAITTSPAVIPTASSATTPTAVNPTASTVTTVPSTTTPTTHTTTNPTTTTASTSSTARIVPSASSTVTTTPTSITATKTVRANPVIRPNTPVHTTVFLTPSAAKAPTAHTAHLFHTAATTLASSNVARSPINYSPELERFFLPAPKVTAAALNAQHTETAKKTALATHLSKPARPWEAAFTGGIGVSALNRLSFGVKSSGAPPLSAAAPSSSYASYYALTNPAVYTTGAGAKQTVSDIQPDLTFSAGILARKPLSRRWAFTIGLDLLYYSTRVKVGQQVSSYTSAPGSPLALTAAAAPQQPYPYYYTGDEQQFTNRYYFLEIPASLQFQLNHSLTRPLFWEGGLSLSYLMSSNALYYDPNSGIYYKNESAINRAQLSLSTSLMQGLSLGSLRLQLGPQVQYGITNLLPAQTSGTQHLFYGGLRVVIQPGPKK